MRRIPIARGAGDPEQLRTPGLPKLTAWNEDPEPAAQLAEPEPERSEARASTPKRKSSLGPLLGLLAIVGLGVGGYWLWKHPDLVGLEDWGAVQAAFSGDDADEPSETPDDQEVEGELAPKTSGAPGATTDDEAGGEEPVE